jgi:hypothetical protein
MTTESDAATELAGIIEQIALYTGKVAEAKQNIGEWEKVLAADKSRVKELKAILFPPRVRKPKPAPEKKGRKLGSKDKVPRKRKTAPTPSPEQSGAQQPETTLAELAGQPATPGDAKGASPAVDAVEGTEVSDAELERDYQLRHNIQGKDGDYTQTKAYLEATCPLCSTEEKPVLLKDCKCGEGIPIPVKTAVIE